MKLVFLCGAPNSGKSTVAFQLVSSGVVQYVITPGYWLRHLMANKTETNDLANYISNNWNNEILEPIVREHVDEQIHEFIKRNGKNEEKVLIIEGYPRTVREALHCTEWGQKYPTAIIAFDLSLEESKKRAKKRNRQGDDNDESLQTRWHYWNVTVDKMLSSCYPPPNFTFRIDVSALTLKQLQDQLKEIIEQKIIRVVIPERPPVEPMQVNHPPSTFLENVSAQEQGKIIQMHLRLAGTPKRKRQFCGSHPVSLDRTYMPRLRRYPYLCSLKIDGQRLFCVVHAKRLYFLSRKLQVWRTKDSFEALQEYEESLLDGEIALNNLFIVIDVLVFKGQNVMQRPILDRLASSVPLGRLMFNANLRFRPQEYVDRTQLYLLLQRGSHERLNMDGLIFQPAKLPYRLGIDYNLFKWKPYELNTVDLLWGEDGRFYCRKTNTVEENEDDDDEGIKTLDNDSGVMLSVVRGQLHHEFEAELIPWLKAGTVIECGIVLAKENEIEWVPKKPRWDKPFPNMDWVVYKIMDSIKDNITEEELIEYCQEPTLPPSAVPSPPRVHKKLNN